MHTEMDHTSDISVNPHLNLRHAIVLEDPSSTPTRNLLRALEHTALFPAVVFCNSDEDAELVSRYLARFGIRTNKDVYVTDVVPNTPNSSIRSAYNFAFPDSEEQYQARFDCLSQCGNVAVFSSIVKLAPRHLLGPLQDKHGLHFEELTVPSEEDMLIRQSERLLAHFSNEIANVEISQYRPLANALMLHASGQDLVAYLLRQYFNEKKETPKPSHTREERRPAREPREREMQAPAEPINSDTANLYVTLGRNHGFADLAALAQHISERTNVDLGHFTGIGNVRDTSSHIEVDSEVAQGIIDALHGQPQQGDPNATMTCAVALPKSNRPNNNRRHHSNHRRR